jgi:hypothetical protein
VRETALLAESEELLRRAPEMYPRKRIEALQMMALAGVPKGSGQGINRSARPHKPNHLPVSGLDIVNVLHGRGAEDDIVLRGI